MSKTPDGDFTLWQDLHRLGRRLQSAKEGDDPDAELCFRAARVVQLAVVQAHEISVRAVGAMAEAAGTKSYAALHDVCAFAVWMRRVGLLDGNPEEALAVLPEEP